MIHSSPDGTGVKNLPATTGEAGDAMTEDEMVGWHHRLDGHKFEQVPGAGDGQGSMAYCSPQVRHKEQRVRHDCVPELN